MKLSSIILSVLLCLAVALGGFIYLDKDTDKVYIYIFGVFIFLMMIVYIMQAEIDWKWSLRNPPEMPAALERQLATMIPFYRNLDVVEKKRYRDRCMLWIQAKEHRIEGLNTFPEDIKNLIAGYGVMMTFGIEFYLLQPYERVVIYPHPFPSPNFKVLHNSEVNHEDGVTVFNVAAIMAAFNKPLQYYNLVLHEYAAVFMHLYPDFAYPKFESEEKSEQLQQVRGMTLEAIQKLVGLPTLDKKQVAIEHFFMNPTRFQALLPEEYQQLAEIFNMNPLQAGRPVLDIKKIGDNPLAGEIYLNNFK